MAKAKKLPPLKGSHAAPPLVAEALRQLLRTQAKQAILAKRVKLLKRLIVEGGGGTAHGYRTFVSPVRTSLAQRTVRVKDHGALRIVKQAVTSL